MLSDAKLIGQAVKLTRIGRDNAKAATQTKVEIRSIQYLRAIAAISVLVFHLSEQFGGSFSIGAAGVDLFFVISGFIMWSTTARRATTARQFAVHRLIRVVPLYWIVTAAMTISILVKPQFFYNHVLTLGNVVGSLVFVPAIHRGGFYPVASIGWTLCYEMFFYALFTLTLLGHRRWRPMLLIASLIVLASLHWFLPPGYLRQYTSPIILEFLLGILIGMVWIGRYQASRWLSCAVLALGVSALAISQMGIAADLLRPLRWGVPAALIVLGVVLLEKYPWQSSDQTAAPGAKQTGVYRLPILGFLGDASYSIYLWHGLLLPVTTAVVLHLQLPIWAQATVMFIVTLSMSALLSLVIERPLILWLRGVEMSRFGCSASS